MTDIANHIKKADEKLEKLKLRKKLLEDQRHKAEEEKEKLSMLEKEQEELEISAMTEENEKDIEMLMELDKLKKDAKKEIELAEMLNINLLKNNDILLNSH